MNVSRNTRVLRISVSALLLGTSFVLAPVVGNVSAMSATRLTRLEVLIFRTPIVDFAAISKRRSGEDAFFDWTTDFCSAPLVGSTGRSFDFTIACTRHDFAYRNYKRADSTSPKRGQLWNSSIRHRIDTVFQKDMRNHCSQRPITERATCHAWAELFYRLVRVAGGP